jgi:hypothetical protein
MTAEGYSSLLSFRRSNGPIRQGKLAASLPNSSVGLSAGSECPHEHRNKRGLGDVQILSATQVAPSESSTKSTWLASIA